MDSALPTEKMAAIMAIMERRREYMVSGICLLVEGMEKRLLVEIIPMDLVISGESDANVDFRLVCFILHPKNPFKRFITALMHRYSYSWENLSLAHQSQGKVHARLGHCM